MKIRNIKIIDLLMLLIFFFMPYTTFRIVGFKLSEIFTILLIFLSIRKELFVLNIKENKSRFVFLFAMIIIISALLSYIDPINSLVYGIDSGIYYSFEFGWLFRVVRLFILYFLVIILNNRFKNSVFIKNLCIDTYLLSCLIVGIVGIFQIFGTGQLIIGVTRTSLMAQEASEAGFINVFAIILAIFMYIMKKKRIYVISAICLVIIQLFIGSTASLISGVIAIAVSLIYFYHIKEKKRVNKLIIYLIIIFIAIVGFNYLKDYTHILNKIINYKYFLTIKGSSVAERITAVETCINIFKKRPILGVGIGNFGWYLSRFVTSDYLNYVPGGAFQPNNLYFQLLAELGILGFSIYSLFIYRIFKKIQKILKADISYGSLCLCLLIYLMIHNMTLTTLFSFQFWLLVTFIDVNNKYGEVKNDLC